MTTSRTIEQEIKISEKAMSFEPRAPVNYPINLGFPSPSPSGFFEFAIIGEQDEKREAIPKVMKLFESNSATIVSISFSNYQSFDRFVMNVICDLNYAKCAPDELLIRVNKLKNVKVAELSQLDGRVFGGFMFPLTFFGEIRALAMDADRFVHLFDDVIKTSGLKAKNALFQNGRLEGNEIIATLTQKLGERAKDKQFLFENARALLQTAGWGKLFFYPEGTDLYKVTINDPPADADGNAITGNYFLHGLIAGILEPFLKSGVRLSMIREGYEVEKRDLVMYYMDKAAIRELASEEEEESKANNNNNELSLTKSVSVNSDSIKIENKEEKKIDDTLSKVKEIIESIDEIKQEKKNKGNGENPSSSSSSLGSLPPVTLEEGQKIVQGEIVGSGIQIIQQTDPAPLPRRKKKIAPQDKSSV
jgi:hypothetical protein